MFRTFTQLGFKHGIGEGPLQESLRQVLHLVVCLKVSLKRKQILLSACAQLNLMYKAPQLNGEVNVHFVKLN